MGRPIEDAQSGSRKRARTDSLVSVNAISSLPEAAQDALAPGSVIVARVSPAPKDGFRGSLQLKVLPWCSARLLATEVSDVDTWKSDPFEKMKVGAFIRCAVLSRVENSRDGSVVDVSVRPSLMAHAERQQNGREALPDDVVASELRAASAYASPGELVKGFVETVNRVGVFVRVSRGVLAIAPLKDLADYFVEDAAAAFPPGKLVAGRVVHSDAAARKLVLSLRPSAVLGTAGQLSLGSLQEGQAYAGVVASTTNYGVFVRFSGGDGRLSGLVHTSEISDGKAAGNHEKLFSPGDKVRVVVLKVDLEKRRVALSMKPSRLEEAGGFSDDEENADDDDDGEDVENDAERVLAEMDASSSSSDDDGESMDDNDDAGSANEEGDSDDDAQPLSLADALARTGAAAKQDDQAESSDDDEDSSNAVDSDGGHDDAAGKSTKRDRRAEAKRRAKQRALDEAETAAREQEQLDSADAAPRSADDFERLLLSSPNSSLLWIQYMAFQAAQMELDRARSVAERALQTINFRMEAEKQNVLLALLRLECRHGDKRAVQDATRRLLERSDKLEGLLRVASVHEELGDLESADEALRKAVKASAGASETPWLRRIELKLRSGAAQEARELLKQAQRAVDKKLRIPLYLGYARLEFSLKESGKGEPDRARTVLEALLEEHPKRNDVWLQFVDMETKFGGDVGRVRKLYERATALPLSVRRVKTFFKNWLVFETEHGDEAGAEAVKARARAYVESAVAARQEH